MSGVGKLRGMDRHAGIPDPHDCNAVEEGKIAAELIKSVQSLPGNTDPAPPASVSCAL